MKHKRVDNVRPNSELFIRDAFRASFVRAKNSILLVGARRVPAIKQKKFVFDASKESF